MDALLLSGLVAFVTVSARTSDVHKLLGQNSSGASTTADALQTFLSLLPLAGTGHAPSLPPLCPLSPKTRRKLAALSDTAVAALFARFSNNNFVIHAPDLTAVAHGIFPSASRAFNHSCRPNAWAVYTFEEGGGVVVNVRAGKALAGGEEVRFAI